MNQLRMERDLGNFRRGLKGSAVQEALVERIYEAAFIPERWDDVLQSLAEIVGGVSGAPLIYHGVKQPRWRSTPLIDEVLSGYCTSDAWQKSELTTYMVNVPPADFFYDADYFPEELLKRDRMRAPLRQLGIGNQLGTLMPMPRMMARTMPRTVVMPMRASRKRPSANRMRLISKRYP